MENPNPSRNPAREPGTGNDDGGTGTDPRRTREQDENERTKRQIPNPHQRPDQAPKTA